MLIRRDMATKRLPGGVVICTLLLAIWLSCSWPAISVACANVPQTGNSPSIEQSANRDNSGNNNALPTTAPKKEKKSMNFLELMFLGGWFMIPLLALSLFAAALIVERGIALRRSRLLPEKFIRRLGQLGEMPGGLDPREAYRICQNSPSAAADIFRSVLVKVGRPHAELEKTLSESSQRAADNCQRPVSWLTLTAAIAPLIGLLGTVWGITQSFHDTTQLEVGQNRADALSHGIYTALVTTVVGLLIAIPATFASHFFESRIVKFLNQIEEMLLNLLPQLERYEGQLRFTNIGEKNSGTAEDDEMDFPPPRSPARPSKKFPAERPS